MNAILENILEDQVFKDKKFDIVSAQKIKIDNDFKINGLSLESKAMNDLCQIVGIPSKLFKHLNHLDQNLNIEVNKKLLNSSEQNLILYIDEKHQTIISATSRIPENDKIIFKNELESMFNYGDNNEIISKYEVDYQINDTQLLIKFLNADSFAVKTLESIEDLFKTGFQIKFDFTQNNTSARISNFIYRLVCKNGATVQTPYSIGYTKKYSLEEMFNKRLHEIDREAIEKQNHIKEMIENLKNKFLSLSELQALSRGITPLVSEDKIPEYIKHDNLKKMIKNFAHKYPDRMIHSWGRFANTGISMEKVYNDITYLGSNIPEIDQTGREKLVFLGGEILTKLHGINEIMTLN